MSSRLPPAALSLKQFLQRQKVLAVYRNMFRTIRQVPDEADRKYLRDWAREEFKRNKNATNQIHVITKWPLVKSSLRNRCIEDVLLIIILLKEVTVEKRSILQQNQAYLPHLAVV
ncbi:hypothetical protein CHARACLAT_033027 [Characodon lateralis]|uniref:LYR motif-containing protein 2 n=1 Tax=Characodon lateralis TaxID=208331 RepID=A0ABU7E7G3_9TELE|nr:hypothetical protein [Characodon lateralis]